MPTFIPGVTNISGCSYLALLSTGQELEVESPRRG